MTEQQPVTGAPPPDPGRFVPPAGRPATGRLLHIPLHLADRPLVSPGQAVESGQPIIEHFREQVGVEVESSAGVISIPPGAVLDNVPADSSGRLGRRSSEGSYRTRVAEHGRDGITRLVAGSGEVNVDAPASGVIEAVTPARVDLRASGSAVDALIGWGPMGKTLWMFIGGVLIGFGTRLAGGCTSGHGIFGISNFESSGFASAACFMVAGMVTTNLIYRVILGV